VEKNKICVGDKITFAEEVMAYTVKAKSDNYAICTKPFNPRKTVLYTIIGFNEDVRGRNNLVFNCYDYSKQKDIDQCLFDLESGETGISHRNRIPLNIKKIVVVYSKTKNAGYISGR
jgi:hypothetical protein